MEEAARREKGVLSNAVEAAKDVFASIVGSAACVYSGQPFDTVKVRMQVKPGEFMSATECIRRTIATEGVVALWYGSVPAFLGAMSENAVAFSVNGTIKRVLGIRDNASSDYQPPLHEPFLIGGVTGSITAFVLCPCDVLKCRAQTNHANGLARESFTQLLQRTYRMEGMRGLYKGMGAQILRDIPFYSSFFGSYDILCMGLKRFTSLSDTAVYFLAGGLAGQIAWAASIGPDVVKSRIQSSTGPNPGILVTSREIYRMYGARGFLVGVEVALFRAFPANAALFVGYELSRKLVA